MCKHEFIQINNAKVCKRCGMTVIGGKVMFDRKFPNYKEKRKKRGKK